MSLLTGVPIKETMDLQGRKFEEEILRLFCHILMVSGFAGPFMNKLTVWPWTHHSQQSSSTSACRTSKRGYQTPNNFGGFDMWKHICNFKIQDFHGSDSEECRVLGSYAIWLLQEPTFQRNLAPPSSG
jgi:hypothetical protein